jgi:hypothetical protein
MSNTQTANFLWAKPQDGDSREKGSPWGSKIRLFMDGVDNYLALHQTALNNSEQILTNAIASNNALIDSKIADAKSAIITVQNYVASNNALIDSKIADAKSAITTVQNYISTEFTPVANSVTNINTTLFTPTTGLIDKFTSLNTTVASNSSTLTNLDHVVTTATTGLVDRFTSLSSTVDGHTSSINNLDKVVNTNTDSLVNKVSTLSSDMTTAKADIANIQSIGLTTNSAIVSTVSSLNATVGTMSGTVNNLQAVVIDGTNPLVTQMSTLTATVAGHTSEISTLMSSTGATAMWGIQINNNNRITGIVLNSDANQHTTFDIMVDSFNLIDPSNTLHTPFSYSNGAIHLDSNIVVNAAVNLQSSNYQAGSANNAPVGFKLSGTPFTAYYLASEGGGTEQVLMEIGNNVSIGGHKAQVLVDKLFNPVVVSSDVSGSSYHSSGGGYKVLSTGQGIYITPTSSTRLLIIGYGNLSAGSNGGSGSVQLYYGTGTKPDGGAFTNGTAIQAPYYTTIPSSGAGFSITAIITGLTIGTQYWIDFGYMIVLDGDGSTSLTGHIYATEF